MKRLLLLTVLLGYSYLHQGQNLIPNSEFDTYSTCPYDPGQIDFAPPWFSANGKTVDFAHVCAGATPTGIPLNRWGEQSPLMGNGYAGIRTFFYTNRDIWENYREYLSVPLIAPLDSGRYYYVRFYVSAGETARYYSDDIGLALTESVLALDVLPYTPAIRNPEGQILSDYTNWREISGTYMAKGGEKYATIGNFLHDSLTTLAEGGAATELFNSTYYYIDDVLVTPCAISSPDSIIIASKDTFCSGTSVRLELNPKLSIASYQWFDNSLTTSVTPSDSGWYWLEVVDYHGCHLRDSVYLHEVLPPILDLGADTVICPGESWTLFVADQPGVQYLWENGDTQPFHFIDGPGTYEVELKSRFCTVSDELVVSYPPVPLIAFGFDSLICEGQEIALSYVFPDAQYTWQDLSSDPVFVARESGTYSLRIQTQCYEVADEFVLQTINCDCVESIPNVFTPNGDGVNEQWWIAFNPGVKNIQLGIMDRWGRQVFQSQDANARWDGTYKGQEMPPGVYYWWANYRCWNGKQIVDVQNNGPLSLFR